MTSEELELYIEKRYSECSKRNQGLSYGSFYDGYMDCYREQEKRIAELEQENGRLEGKVADLQSEYIELENLKNNEIEELDKENERLKDELGKCAETPVKYCVAARGTITELEKKIAKAKEIIKQLTDGTGVAEETLRQASQFLKESEKGGVDYV